MPGRAMDAAPLPLSGRLLDCAELAAVEPDDAACVAGVDDDRAGTVVRMDLHPAATERAQDGAAEFGGVDRPWRDLRPGRGGSAGGDDFSECAARDEDAAARAAGGDGPAVEHGGKQRSVAEAIAETPSTPAGAAPSSICTAAQ